jgi:hypothetical protein
MNSPSQPNCVGSDSRLQFIWHRNCRQHAAELTVQAANKEKFERCIYCDGPASLPSQPQQASEAARHAAKLLRDHPRVELVITEAKVLKKKYGGFDFSCVLRCPRGTQEQRRLEVEVDGPQHFSKQYHDHTAEAQQAADRRKDEAAWKAGRCLLCLHYLDSARWARAIDKAVRLATLPSRNKLRLYTRSYAKKDKVAKA